MNKAGKLYRTFPLFPLKLKKVRCWTFVFESPGVWFGWGTLVKVTRVATSDKIKRTRRRKSSPTHTSPRPQSLKRFVSGHLVAELSGLFYLEGVG